MRYVTNVMLLDLHQSVSTGGSRGSFTNSRWMLAWRFDERRIEDQVREDVFIIQSVHVQIRHRGRGHLTELLKHLTEYPAIGHRRIDWIYLEQVNFRFANHLERELSFKSDFGLVIDCWRQVTGQLEMKL